MNMTGLRIMFLGSSLMTLSRAAPRTMAGSNSERRVAVDMVLLEPELLDDGAEGEDGEVREPDDDDDDAGEEPGEQRRVGREGAGRGRDGRLAGKAPSDGEGGDDQQ